MRVKSTIAHERIGRVRQRRQVVIPRAMTARKLIEILEALPPNTRIPVEPSVISTLKGKVQDKPEYVSEEEQDRIDAELLRKRSKADRKFIDWETVKKRYGFR